MTELQNIIEQHPQSVALVFSRWGYADAEVTAENIQALAQYHGQQFLADLATQLASAGYVWPQ